MPIKFHKLTRIPKGADPSATPAAIPGNPDIAVIIKLPRQSKWAGTRIRDFQRVPGQYDERHIFQGRPLTIEEFNSCAEKVFGDTTFNYRPVPQIIAGSGAKVEGEASGETNGEMPTIEDIRAMLAAIDELRAENEKLRAVVDDIGRSTTAPPPVSAPEPAPEPKPTKGQKKAKT